jgi:hypothetical protein
VSSRWLVILLGAVAAVVLFVVLRPDGDDEASDTSTTTTATQPDPPPAGTTTQAEPPPPPPPPGPPPPARIRVSFRDGTPVGGIRRVTVANGRRVVLVVTSDVPDHVHLHGYDIFRDVAPGMPARLAFRATLPGRFEVEMEDRAVQVVDLRVNP